MKLTLILLYFPPNFSGPFILVAGEMCVNQMCNKRPHTWLPELISTKDRTNNNYYVERLKEFMVISVVDDEECLFYLSLSLYPVSVSGGGNFSREELEGGSFTCPTKRVSN